MILRKKKHIIIGKGLLPLPIPYARHTLRQTAIKAKLRPINHKPVWRFCLIMACGKWARQRNCFPNLHEYDKHSRRFLYAQPNAELRHVRTHAAALSKLNCKYTNTSHSQHIHICTIVIISLVLDVRPNRAHGKRACGSSHPLLPPSLT